MFKNRSILFIVIIFALTSSIISAQNERTYSYMITENVDVSEGRVTRQIGPNAFFKLRDGKRPYTERDIMSLEDIDAMYILINKDGFVSLDKKQSYACKSETGTAKSLHVIVKEYGMTVIDKKIDLECECISTDAPDAVCDILNKIDELDRKY